MRRIARIRRGAARFSAAAIWFWGARVSAQAIGEAPPERAPERAPERVRIAYRAPAECPSEAEFQERVRSRVQRARFAEPGEPGHAFEITLSHSDGDAGFLGRLEFADSDGRRATRLLEGKKCDELASSLALITALALDDRTAEAAPAATSPEPSPPPVEPSAPTPKTNPEPSVPPRLPEPPDRSPTVPSRFQVGLGVSVGALTWVHARTAPAFGAFVELAARTRSSGWTVRLSAFDVRSQVSLDGGDGHVDFPADFLRLEGCPVTLALGWDFSLAPCVAFDGGQLRSTTVNPPDTLIARQKSTDHVWAAGVALGRLSWSYHERIVLGLDGELGVPFVHRTYALENPSGTVLETARIGLGMNLGLGLRFP